MFIITEYTRYDDTSLTSIVTLRAAIKGRIKERVNARCLREMRRLRNKMNANGNAKLGVNTSRIDIYTYAENVCCVNRTRSGQDTTKWWRAQGSANNSPLISSFDEIWSTNLEFGISSYRRLAIPFTWPGAIVGHEGIRSLWWGTFFPFYPYFRYDRRYATRDHFAMYLPRSEWGISMCLSITLYKLCDFSRLTLVVPQFGRTLEGSLATRRP